MDTKSGVTLNQDQRLYVIPCGKGFTCLGFDVAQKWTEDVAGWLKRPDLVPAEKGTLAAYAAYETAMREGGEHNRKTGEQCPAQLIPQFVGREGERVEVQDREGNKRRFYIGKSTGWLPIHLEISRRNSSGGMAAYLPEGYTVRFLGIRR